MCFRPIMTFVEPYCSCVRRDIEIHADQIFRVVLRLERDEPIVIRSVSVSSAPHRRPRNSSTAPRRAWPPRLGLSYVLPSTLLTPRVMPPAEHRSRAGPQIA